jgi:orotidine-5'-phosphate decarboxylase
MVGSRAGGARKPPIPILALDVPATAAAFALLRRVPRAEWVKVGLQLFTAAGPSLVRDLRADGRRVFLDLKYHDIPTTVAGAIASAAELGVELLTVHAAGGREMLSAASRAAASIGPLAPRLLAVTLLTSVSAREAAEAWGRADLEPGVEVVRLASLATECGIDGVVASVHELGALRAALGRQSVILTPGIRLPGDAAGDQARTATPAEAAQRGADFLVVGRSVTAASDPSAAWERVEAGILRSGAE